MLVAWEIGEALKEALHFGLDLGSARGIALKSLVDDRIKGWAGHQNLVPAFDGFIAIANGWVMYPIVRLYARFHFLRHLAVILFTFQCALDSHDGLDELALGRTVELEVQTFDGGTAPLEGIAQVEMEPSVTGKAFEII